MSAYNDEPTQDVRPKMTLGVNGYYYYYYAVGTLHCYGTTQIKTEGTFTWKISSRDDSIRAEIVQC